MTTNLETLESEAERMLRAMAATVLSMPEMADHLNGSICPMELLGMRDGAPVAACQVRGAVDQEDQLMAIGEAGAWLAAHHADALLLLGEAALRTGDTALYGKVMPTEDPEAAQVLLCEGFSTDGGHVKLYTTHHRADDGTLTFDSIQHIDIANDRPPALSQFLEMWVRDGMRPTPLAAHIPVPVLAMTLTLGGHLVASEDMPTGFQLPEGMPGGDA